MDLTNSYSTSRLTTSNSDYSMTIRLYSLLSKYFEVTGWKLDKDENYGIISLTSIYDNNHLKIDRFTTLFLYVCRLIYEEGREYESSFNIVKTDTQTVVEKMSTLGLLENGKTTQKERIEAQRTLAYYNIIQKVESSTWRGEGNQILILPSILMIITNQGINDMMFQLDEMKVNASEGQSGKEDKDEIND